MLHSFIAILGGVIAASSLITSRRPQAYGFISSISEYKGFIGLALLIWGVIGIFDLLSNGLFSNRFIGLIMVIAEFTVGFLLSYELVQEYILKNNAKASEVGEDMRRGLTKYQEPAGIALIVVGIVSFF